MVLMYYYHQVTVLQQLQVVKYGYQVGQKQLIAVKIRYS